MQKVRYRVIFKKLQAAQLKHQIEITCSKIPSYLEAATHYLPSHQIFIFQHTLTYPTCPPPYRFNTATRRWLVAYLFQMARIRAFQHTAARRRLPYPVCERIRRRRFNTQPPEGGWRIRLPSFVQRSGFNTQPPEGGWGRYCPISATGACFNTQPPEGGWDAIRDLINALWVSTHSRPKAAGSVD